MRPGLYRRCNRIAATLAMLGGALSVGLWIMMLNIQPGNPGSGAMILLIFLPLSVFGLAAKVWSFGKTVRRIDASRAAQQAKGARVAWIDWVVLATGVLGMSWLSYDFVRDGRGLDGTLAALDGQVWGFPAVPTVLMAVVGTIPLIRQARGLPKLDPKRFRRCAQLAAFVLPLAFYGLWVL